jgi:hypothetical protein
LKIGISIYASDEYDVRTNMEYIDMASFLGVSNIFTSFNAAIQDKASLDHAMQIIKHAKLKNINIMVDVSPKVFKWIDVSPIDLDSFYQMGISDIRCDYGFNAKEIATMSNNNYGIDVVINASTVTQEEIEEILKHGGCIDNIKACHNFYPRKFTGLSNSFFNNKTTMLRSYGIEVSAFIPSQSGKRGPLYEGLPTIENHRSIPSVIAAKELAYGGMIDVVYFGDAYASEQELKKVLNIDKDIIEIEVEFFEGISDIEKKILFHPCHINRLDASEYIIRSSQLRSKIDEEILPFNCIERNINVITIDNKNAGRYMGELQIIRKPIPQDFRVNVVGKVDDQNASILNYIQPGRNFKLVEKGGN